MKLSKISHLILVSLFLLTSSCQSQKSDRNFNLDFELNTIKNTLPDGWIRWGTNNYSIIIDTKNAVSGNNSLLISQTSESSGKSFGSIAYKLPAEYKATTITLTGYIKTENVSEGFAGLLLREDGVGGSLVFDNMQNQNIHGTNDWTKYEITLPFQPEAKRIFVGGILVGKGKAWFDNFEVFLDSVDITKIVPIVKDSVKAELDKEFDNGSNIKIIHLKGVQIDNLYKVGKVWGFLKYYHPEIALGNYNWDYELIRMLPDVLKIENRDSINEFLLKKINKLGQISPEDKLTDDSQIKLNPDVNWIYDVNFLGEQLSSTLVNIKNCKKWEKHYYIDLVKKVRNPIFQNEKTYSNLKFDDDGIKLVGLFRYWNMIRYYYPYRNLIDENWDQVLKSFIPRIVFADDELLYKLTLLELISKISAGIRA